ncbi:hypothetical protein CLOM621_07186 [Clostridium sp. M62/1]|nr:hypothetical protein CLOM621_07186 [Clostridium sp. M62/1]
MAGLENVYIIIIFLFCHVRFFSIFPVRIKCNNGMLNRVNGSSGVPET